MDLTVLVPVGPSDDVLDTLDSIVHFTDGALDMVIVDDAPARQHSYDDIFRRVRGQAVVIPALRSAPGGRGGLYLKLSQGMIHIARHLDPRIVLRIDADALMIGPGTVDQPVAFVDGDPTIGILGARRTGPDGGTRDWSPAAHVLQAEAGVAGLVQPRRRRRLRALLRLAASHGYEAGEHALGGAYFITPEAIRAVHRHGWLELDELASSGLGEDHIFALLVRAAGYRIAELGGPGDTLAVRWQGLPAAPEALVDSGATVTHSVRFWQDRTEDDIRRFFRERRTPT